MNSAPKVSFCELREKPLRLLAFSGGSSTVSRPHSCRPGPQFASVFVRLRPSAYGRAAFG